MAIIDPRAHVQLARNDIPKKLDRSKARTITPDLTGCVRDFQANEISRLIEAFDKATLDAKADAFADIKKQTATEFDRIGKDLNAKIANLNEIDTYKDDIANLKKAADSDRAKFVASIAKSGKSTVDAAIAAETRKLQSAMEKIVKQARDSLDCISKIVKEKNRSGDIDDTQFAECKKVIASASRDITQSENELKKLWK